MLDTFAVSFRLKNAYRVNGIIYSLKSLPLIKKLLPASLYGSRGLKIFANIISGIMEFLSVFCGKAIYLLLAATQVRAMSAPPGQSLAHMLIFLTVIGGILNTYIFDPTRDKFYAMFIMRMDAKKYTLTGYACFLLKMLAGFAVVTAIVGAWLGVSALTIIAVPVYVVCVKLCFTAVSLADCRKKRRAKNENKFSAAKWVVSAVLLALAAVPYTGWALPEWTLWALTAAAVIPALLSLRYIVRFDEYRPIYKELLRPEIFTLAGSKSAAGAAQQLAMQKKISADMSQTSNKSGWAYFNELFMKRHSKLLTRSAKRITLASAAIVAVAAAAVLIFPAIRPDVNRALMTYLPYFLFIMYLINRGRSLTQAMFMNCDHSMLAYRFYRQPGAILPLFMARLRYVIVINLMPAAVIALGLPLLLCLTGGTTEPMNYAVLFVSIIAMSIFFSVHSMVLYYLLQPYNVNLESKSAAYGIISWLTYMVSYMAIQVQLPTLSFGTAISAFCIVYAAVATILAYRLAPRTFKLR